MPLKELQRRLAAQKKKFEFKINDNRSTMLSVRWEPDCTKVSLHKMFLRAPQSVVDHLAGYLKREKKSISPQVREFIESNLKKLDYSWQLDLDKLEAEGDVYHLGSIYKKLNRDYFEGKLDLNITWFATPKRKNPSRITFGLYCDQLRLIKINRMMDHPIFPDYVISYVVYHEMLHHVCPSYYDVNGRHCVHSKEFKAQERKFEHFHLADGWIKNHQGALFNYGWA